MNKKYYLVIRKLLDVKFPWQKGGSSMVPLFILALFSFLTFSSHSNAQDVAVFGQVLDRDSGLGLEGVAVYANGGSATTDADGNYSFTLDQFERQDGSIYIAGSTIFRNSGVGGGSLSLVAPFPKQYNFTAVSAPETLLQGRVVDSYGNPVSGVDVSLDVDSPAGDLYGFYEYTDADGIYSVPGSEVTEDQAVSGLSIGRIELRKEGFLDIRESFSPPLQSGSSFPFELDDFVFTNLDGTLAVTGQVTDQYTGDPLAGIAVYANGGSTATDADGNYSFTLDQFENLEGSIYIHGNTIYRSSSLGGGNLTLEAPFPKQFDFTAVTAPERLIQGRIVDSYGNPASGVEVNLDVDSTAGDLYGFYVYTDADGIYSVRGSEVTEDQAVSGISIRRIEFRKEGFLDISESFSPPLQTGSSFPFEIDEFVFTNLDDTLAVTGQVIDRITGYPLEGVAVYANGGSTATDADGNYSFTLNQFGRQDGSIYIAGNTIYRNSGVGGGSLSLLPPFPKQFDFTAVLAPELFMQGLVTDSYGNPVPGVEVSLDVDSPVDYIYGFYVSTDTDGIYSVRGSELTEEQAASSIYVEGIELRKDGFLDIRETFTPPLESTLSFPFLMPDFSLLCVSNCPIIDTDNDAVQDSIDLCLETLPGATVDFNGCSDIQVDSDADGFCNPSSLSSGPSMCVGVDNCPTLPNDQTDVNNDGIGDACLDPDSNVDLDAFGTNPTIGIAVSVGSGSVFGDEASLGDNTIVRRNVTAGDNVTIADNSEIRNGASLGNNVSVGADALIFARAVLADGVVVGNSAIIRQDTQLGENVTVGDSSIVRQGTQLGNNVIVGADAIISREVVVGENSTISEGVRLRRGAVIGTGVQIGPNVLIRKEVVIGDDVQIGLDCLPALSVDDPPCVIVSRNTSIGSNSLLGTDIIIRREVIIPPNQCVADGSVVPVGSTVDSPCP